jgi:hypothetical protein
MKSGSVSIFMSTLPVIYGSEDAIICGPDGNFHEVPNSDTSSALFNLSVEPELVPYECTVRSGSLDFWRDDSEDIYTWEDGQAL